MDSEFCRLLGVEVPKSGNIHHVELSSLNRPFPSSLMPLFQNESKCEKLLEGLKVAPNLKSCSKGAEQLVDSPSDTDQVW